MKKYRKNANRIYIGLLTLLISATAEAQFNPKLCYELLTGMFDGKDVKYVSIEVTRSAITHNGSMPGYQFSSYFREQSKVDGTKPNRNVKIFGNETFSDQSHFSTGSAVNADVNFSESGSVAVIHGSGPVREIELTFCGKAPENKYLVFQGIWTDNSTEYSIYNFTLVSKK